MSHTTILELKCSGLKPGTFRMSGPQGEPDFYKDDGDGAIVDPSGRAVGCIDYTTGEYGFLGIDEALQQALAPEGRVSLPN